MTFQKIKEKNKMKNQKIVPIFFSCDDNYIPFLSVALTSIIKNASKEYFYHFYILHSDTISKLNQERISASHIKENVKIEFVDITDYVVKISEKLHTRDYYSKSTYYRLFIPNLYPQYDKVLYLDSDIVVCGDISKLFNIELGNNLVGAITDGAVSQVKPFQDYVEKRVGVAHHSKYFNAGILLMNNRRLREIDFEELFINLLSRVTFTVAQDQDYLNAICRDKVTYIDNSWNQMPINYQDYGKGTPNLVHYNLSFKPWHIDGVAYADLFWKYAKKCTYYKDILTIKENYSPELQMMSEKETEELIKKAIRESLELEKNFIIDSEIKSVHARMK